MSSRFAQEKFIFPGKEKKKKPTHTVEKSCKVNNLEMERRLQQILGTKFSYFSK